MHCFVNAATAVVESASTVADYIVAAAAVVAAVVVATAVVAVVAVVAGQLDIPINPIRQVAFHRKTRKNVINQSLT